MADVFDASDLRALIDRAGMNFVQLADSHDMMSGYKLHVWCGNTADVEAVWSRLAPVVAERGLAAKAATAAFFRSASEGQAHKGITVYLPKRASFQQDARAVVRAMEGYEHHKDVEGDLYLANGVNWRFELSEDPRRDVSLKTYLAMYAPAHKGQPQIPPLAHYSDMQFRIRDAKGNSLSRDVLEMLSRHRKDLEVLVRSQRENQPFSLSALDSPLLRTPFSPGKETEYDDLLVSALTALGFDAEPRSHAAAAGVPERSAGVKITAGTGFPLSDERMLSLLAPYCLDSSAEVTYGKDSNTLSIDKGELRISGNRIQDLGATILRSEAPRGIYESMAVRVRGPNQESRSYEALQSLSSIRKDLDRALPGGSRFKTALPALRDPALSVPKDASQAARYDELLADTLVALGMEATVRETVSGKPAGVKITSGTGSFDLDKKVFSALEKDVVATSFSTRYGTTRVTFTFTQGSLEATLEASQRAMRGRQVS